jgi:uncharacterized protein YbjT (DUF2867 family)
MSAHTLVIGATGTVGSAVVEALRARGQSCAALSSRAGASLPAGVTVVHGDLRDPGSLPHAMAGVDQLFLLLPLVPDMATLDAHAVQAARAAGVRHVLRVSAMAADVASPSALQRLHGELDARLLASGIPCTVLRPAGFMQNYSTYGAGMIRAGTYFAAHGEAAQALIDVADIAACAAAVLADPAPHAGAVYTLTGARTWTHAEAMAVIGAALGRELNHVPVPDAAARAALVQMGVPEVVQDWLDGLNGLIRQGALAEPTDTVQALSGRPPTPLQDFVQRHLDIWR